MPSPFMRCSLGSEHFLYAPNAQKFHEDLFKLAGINHDVMLEADHICKDLIGDLVNEPLGYFKDSYFPQKFTSRVLEYTFRDYLVLNLKPE